MTNLEGRYYADISETVEASSATDANAKLNEGYELLAIKERTTEMQATGGPVIRTEPVYILGMKRRPSPMTPDPEIKYIQGMPVAQRPVQEATNRTRPTGWIRERDVQPTQPDIGSNTTPSPTSGKKFYCKDYTRKDGTTFVGCGKEIVWGKVDGRPKPLNPDGSPHTHEVTQK